MPTIIISGLKHEWDALNHLQTWVSKNANSCFVKDNLRLARGCSRDKLITLRSVKLGSIEGTVSDGNGSSCTVRLTRLPGILTASCDCSEVVKTEEDQSGVKQEVRIIDDASPNTPCHHLAAFLIYISDAKPKETAVFVCGEPNVNFDLRGYVALYSTDELINICGTKQALSCRIMGAKFRLGAILDGRDQGVAAAHANLENIIDTFQGGQNGGDPSDLSAKLDNPLRKLIPLFNNHPQEVMMILKRVITLLSEADLEVYEVEDVIGGVEEQPKEFDSTSLWEVCFGFILSKPEGTRRAALVEMLSHIKALTGRCVDWEVFIQKSDADIGPELLKFVSSSKVLKYLSNVHSVTKLLARFPQEDSIELEVIKLELATCVNLPPTTIVDTKNALKLINLYISSNQPQKAIEWIDSRIEGGRTLKTSRDTSLRTRYRSLSHFHIQVSKSI